MERVDSTYPPHRLGAWGEDVATDFLRYTGWTILARGYRLGRREIDVVASRAGTLAFVEVKTRSGAAYGPPESAVTRRKRLEIEAVALDYLTRRRPVQEDVRFDVIAIVVVSGRRIVRLEHIEDAWRPDAR